MSLMTYAAKEKNKAKLLIHILQLKIGKQPCNTLLFKSNDPILLKNGFQLFCNLCYVVMWYCYLEVFLPYVDNLKQEQSHFQCNFNHHSVKSQLIRQWSQFILKVFSKLFSCIV